jgi:hypothetical protein
LAAVHRLGSVRDLLANAWRGRSPLPGRQEAFRPFSIFRQIVAIPYKVSVAVDLNGERQT